MTDNPRFWSLSPWRPLPSIVHAVCVRHFDAAGQDDLSLQLGDEVYITEVCGQENQWCRGWLLAQPSPATGLAAPQDGLRARAYAGIFPRRCVHTREVLAENDTVKSEAKPYGQLRGHSRIASAPVHQRTNGFAPLSHARRGSVPENNTTTATPEKNGLSESPSPPHSQKADSPLAPLIPRDVAPRKRGDPKDPAPLPALRIGEGGARHAEPLVDDISSSIREWQSAKVHDLALNREYGKLDELTALSERLTDARRQLAHSLLTEAELRRLREQVVWDLVRGNKLVDGEVIVRSAAQGGRTLTAYDSLPEMADLQTVMGLRDRPLPSTHKQTHLSHLFMDVRAVPQHLGEPALLHIYLCSLSSSGKPKPVSEAFAVELAVNSRTNMVEIADAFSKTLFAELNNIDVGGGDQSDSRLYLVCRLIRDEPMRVSRQSVSLPSTPNPNATDFEDAGGSSRRRSGRSRSRTRSDAGELGNLSKRPSVLKRRSSTSRVRAERAGEIVPAKPSGEAPDPSRRTRRVAGWAAVSVSSLIRDRASEQVSLSFWAPAVPGDQSVEEPASEGDGWNQVLKAMARSASGRFTKMADVGSLTLDLTAFAANNVNTLVRNKPALLRGVPRTPALSLNGAAKQQRSDIYLTLRGPILPARARAFHPQHGSVPINTETDLLNLQVTLEVRTNDGRRLDDAIHPTANRRPHTAFRSPAIERGEAFNQTIKFSLDPDDLPDAHVIMSIADGADFPFALAWLPLWDKVNGFPPDGQQNLALWDYCEYTANLVDGRGAYQSLPARAEEMEIQNVPQMACLAVETHLSSTSATQNADVLALSALDQTGSGDLVGLLGRFSSIPDEEIAKFFGPILVSLNRILERCSEGEYLEADQQAASTDLPDLTTKALAHAVRLTSDRRYPHLENLLAEYLSRRKTSPDARLALIRSLRSMLAKPFDARGGRELRSCLKVTDILLIFALRSGSSSAGQYDRAIAGIQHEVGEFFEDVAVLLSNTTHLALPTQVIILQNFHTWLPETLSICKEQDILRFASAAIDASAHQQSPLWIHRLSMIHNIFVLDAFQVPSFRSAVIGMTESWLAPVWPETPDLAETDLSALRLCCTVLKAQQPYMNRVQSQRYVQQLISAFYMIEQSDFGSETKSAKIKAARSKRKNFSPLFPTSYPFRTVTIAKESAPSEVLLEITAVLGTFFQPGSIIASGTNAGDEQTQTNGSSEPITMLDESDLAKALFVLRALQSNAAFPRSWLSLSVSLSRCTVNILAWLLAHLESVIPAETENDEEAVLEFDGALWTHWFEALIALVTSEVVRMEEHSEQKRRAVWTIGGDIRESAAQLLNEGWQLLGWVNDDATAEMYRLDRMGGYQVQFTARLIPSIVSLGLSLHSGLRDTAVELLRSMIISEWELSGDLAVIKSAFADALDMAFRDDKFEPNQAKMLVERIKGSVAYLEQSGAEDLHAAVLEVLGEVQVLIEMLLLVHEAAGEHPSSQLEQRVRLLEYLKTTNNEESYLRHIHDVAESQVGNRQYSSAALAMLLHIDLLLQKHGSDADSQLAKAYPELQLPSQTIYQRRQMLYAAIVKYFRMGSCWSKALSTLEQQRNELGSSYDSATMAAVLREEAEIYRKLNTGRGLLMPRFFKVTFTNVGFPNTVMGKSFIFEATPDEDMAKFAKRLKDEYPFATIVHSGVTSSVSAMDQPKIHVISVNVNRDQLNPVNQRPGVSPFYRLHVMCADPMVFSNSTRQQKPGVSVAEQTVAKTIYTASEPLPTMLGRAEIVKEEALVLTPIQAAIDRTQRKTLDIAEALLVSDPTDPGDSDKIVQIVRTSVDPQSPDSVAAYHELLLDEMMEGADLSIRSGSSLRSTDDTSIANGSIQSSTAPSSTIGTAKPSSPLTKLYVKVLNTALEEHARAIEQALATVPDHRADLKATLRLHFEDVFELELHALYPLGDWRDKSPAWRTAPRPDALHLQPPPGRLSLFEPAAPPATSSSPMTPHFAPSRISAAPGAPEQPAAGPPSRAGTAMGKRASSRATAGGRWTAATPSRAGSRMGYYSAQDSETETEAEGPWRQHARGGSAAGRRASGGVRA